MPGGIDMYLKLNNYEYKITAANVGFEMSEDNKSLIMFLDIDEAMRVKIWIMSLEPLDCIIIMVFISE